MYDHQAFKVFSSPPRLPTGAPYYGGWLARCQSTIECLSGEQSISRIQEYASNCGELCRVGIEGEEPAVASCGRQRREAARGERLAGEMTAFTEYVIGNDTRHTLGMNSRYNMVAQSCRAVV